MPNVFLHIQAVKIQWQQRQFKQPGNPYKPRERDLPACQRTAQAVQHCYIPKDVMTERPRLWQAHLSKISNFLKPGPVWWKWREDGSVEFFDAPGEPNSREQWPQLYHFRSSNISRICQNLEAMSGAIRIHCSRIWSNVLLILISFLSTK